ncbi:MAG: precorrin-3B C(17)-methyltransferase [Clostridiales bacterium]|nr:precorrin-3B C(17)-methyltransferase [Clostridiales bacterium]
MLQIIGIGPGKIGQMTASALEALKESDIIVGYSKYVELIGDEIAGKETYTSAMTQEKNRCLKAIELAKEGRNVAVVSSGDAGVYGMAGLIYELAGDNPGFEIKVLPGITAAVSAAAVLGAPLMHDFAVISLSDLMTSWETIEKRIRAAAAADFVICIYNPRSRKRADYLKKACEYMLEYKPADTKCGWVKNIDRDGEEYGICTLDELGGLDADMFTTIIVGNSSTKVVGGKLVTPRGYDI